MAVFAEMRRRNVFKVALLYAVLAWLVVWFVGAIQSEVTVPTWTEAFVFFVLIVGFPVALWFAWTYEITPVGLKKAVDVDQTQSIVYKTGQKLNAAVAVLVVLGVLAVFGQRLLPTFEFLVPGVPEGDAPVRATTPSEIRRLTMDNGMTVIAWPDHDIPNVALYTFVKAGGRNEYPGITGLSHFFEHMMFLGTEKLAPGEFDTLMEAAGGANNAYTTNDVTVYTDWFPRSALETIFELEADRFQNLQTYSDAVESEREVVYAERRLRVDNNNDWKLMEQVFATAFVAHPYQFPVIGWPSDIEQWTDQDLQDFYRTYYAPNNLTMVVVGDVTTEEVFRLADKHFGSIAAQEPPPPVRTVEPEQMGTRRVVVETDAQTPLVHMAFHAAEASDPRSLHLTLLMSILTGGESSRLHRLLVEEEQLALSVDSWWGAWLDPGLAYFFLTLPPDGDPAVVEQRMLEELRRVAEEGVTDAELAKARNIVASDIFRQLATIRGKADALGEYEVFHDDYEALFYVSSRIENISTEQLRETAASVFDTRRMTVGVLQAPPEVEE
ncbi:MAG: pitrilysin family protein [Woeseiaceae bacterium]|nr:pitrilysin family protein [Woeseiaceae bacterium]